MQSYTPPYTITNEIVKLIAIIRECIYFQNPDKQHDVTKINRVRSIQASLAIENSSLSLEQVFSIIEGKQILGNMKEKRIIILP